MFRKFWLISALFFLLLPAGPARSQGEGGRSILLIVPQSGLLADLGEQARRGAELALNTWGGGLNMETRDEAGDTEKAIDLSKVAVVVGYFTESRFQRDAPRYLYFKTPVFLPFLTNPDAAARGPSTFFRLMPSVRDQSLFMAVEILQLKKRPRHILVIKGQDPELRAMADVFLETLSSPPEPEAPPPPPPGRKAAAKPAPKLQPLSPKTPVISAELSRILAGEEIEGLGKNVPDLIIMAVSLPEALNLAPVLADSKWKKATLWGGSYLGFREAGAAFASLSLDLHLCLPPVSLVDPQNKTLQEFKHKYVAAYQAHPTWISALAYDSMTLAIKGISRPDPQTGLLDYFSGSGHQALGSYELVPGAGVAPPLAFLPVRVETLGFLP